MPGTLFARSLTLSALLVTQATGAADAAQSESQELRIPSAGVTMRIPAGWHEGGFSGSAVLASYVEGTGLYPGFSVTREDHDGAGPQAVFDGWTELLSSPTVQAVEALQISGHQALLADVSWTSLLGGLRAVRLIVALDREVPGIQLQ